MKNMSNPLHPRPRFTRDKWIDLNGTWQFAYDDEDNGLNQRWYEDAGRFNLIITVPFPPESALSGIGDNGFHPVIWYRRSFTAKKEQGKRLLIHFGAVDYRAHVWVNGELITIHDGGHTPFCADITANLSADTDQIVVVRAEDQPADVFQPRGKQDWRKEPHGIWYKRTSGIWQTVWLEPVPTNYIKEFQLAPNIVEGSVVVETRFNHRVSGWLDIRLIQNSLTLAAQRVLVNDLFIISTIVIPAAMNGVERDNLLWSPETPNLISVVASFHSEDSELEDKIESYFGFRSVGISENRFLLNDKPYFVRSVLEQGYWPNSHLAAPDANALRYEVELIKSLGFNAVRIHQKVEDPHFLYWADQLGLLVWGEMANAYGFNADAVERFTIEWLSVVKRDRSHPSVVTWVPLNESWGASNIAHRNDQQSYASALYYLTKAIDPTRPVISNDGWEHTQSDIWGIHDYAQFSDQLAERYGSQEAIITTLGGMQPARRRLLLQKKEGEKRPVMLSEFGGLSIHPKDSQAWFGYATARSDEEFLLMLNSLFESVYQSAELAGFCYTQLTDTEQETNGLLDENRNPKFPIETLRAIVNRPSRAVAIEFLDEARHEATDAIGKREQLETKI